MPSRPMIDWRKILKGKVIFKSDKTHIFIEPHHRVRFSKRNPYPLSESFKACK